MAVRMVMRMLRILPQVVLLLKVPIVLDVCLVRLDIKVNYQDPPVWRLHFVTLLCHPPLQGGTGWVFILMQRYDIFLARWEIMGISEK